MNTHEYDDPRVLDERTTQGEQLSLARRQIASLVRHLRLKLELLVPSLDLVRSVCRGDESRLSEGEVEVGVGHRGRGVEVLERRSRHSSVMVIGCFGNGDFRTHLSYSSAVQESVLRDDGQTFPEGVESDLGGVDTVDQDLALRDLDDSEESLQQTRLSSSGSSDDSDLPIIARGQLSVHTV